MKTNITKNSDEGLGKACLNAKNLQESSQINIDELNHNVDKEMTKPKSCFPLEVFPPQIQELIKNANDTVKYDPDYFSAGILSVCATAIGNSVHLFNGSYTSKPILWIAAIGSRGTGKTHPLNFAKGPIDLKDNQSYKEYQQLMQDYNEAEQNTRGKKPNYDQTILTDFTPEKLAEVLKHSQKGTMIFSDELMRWINSFDQYKKGGDQQLYLDLFNGNILTVSRVSKDPIRVPESVVNVLGGMQPEILKQLAQNNRNEDGFLDRFLFIYPKHLEPKLFTGQNILKIHTDNYTRLINNLLDAPSLLLNANPSNIKLFMAWQHECAVKYFNDPIESAIQSKMETYVWRLALIIEIMDQGVEGSFNSALKDENLKKAILLTEYFRNNALTIQDKILTTNPLEQISALHLDLYKSLPTQFKREEVLSLFEAKGISVRSGDRFLKNKELFLNSQNSKELKAGFYKKKY